MGCILLGVMTATGEYSGRQVATTCTAMPRRFSVAVAKALTATVVLTAAAMVAAGGVRLLVPEGEWALPWAVVHLAAMGLLGYAIGLVARQLVASLTAAFVLLVVAGPVLRPYTTLATWRIPWRNRREPWPGGCWESGRSPRWPGPVATPDRGKPLPGCTLTP